MHPSTINALVMAEAGLSMIGLSTALATQFYEHVIRKEPVHFHAYMTIILFAFDLADAIPMVFARTLFRHPWACEAQGLGIVTFEGCIIAWNAFMAIQLYSWIALKTETPKLRARIFPAFCIILLGSLLNALLWRAFAAPFQPAELWCWFPKTAPIARFGATYAYVYVSMLVIVGIFVRLWAWVVQLRPSANQQLPGANQLHDSVRTRVGRQLLLYVCCYCATWFWPLVNRTTQAVRGHSPPWLLVLHILSKPSMGIWDILVYSSLRSQLCIAKRPAHHHRRRPRPRPSATHSPYSRSPDVPSGSLLTLHRPALLRSSLYQTDASPPLPSVSLAERLAPFSFSPPCKPSSLFGGASSGGPGSRKSIFVTTYNCGGGDPEQLDLHEMMQYWLPPGHDLYIIGVQELKGLKRLRSLIHGYLGGARAYHMLAGVELGLGDEAYLADRLSGWIAVTVYAKATDVAQGHVEVLHLHGAPLGGGTTRQGAHLGVGRAGNKGGMCIPIRFYGSTLAILGAHLPADGHRKGHECNVTRRCEALRDLLATRSFDAHLQCMHTILLGDLNFRLRGPPEEVLDEIAVCARETIAQQRKPLRPLKDVKGPDGDGWSDEEEGKAEEAGHKGEEEEEEEEDEDEDEGLTWLHRRYNALHRPSEEDGPEGSHGPPGSQAQVQPQPRPPVSPFEARLLSGRDELRSLQRGGVVCHGFHEGPIHFPPSYRRARHRQGDAYDYTQPERLRACYSTIASGPSLGLSPSSHPLANREDSLTSQQAPPSPSPIPPDITIDPSMDRGMSILATPPEQPDALTTMSCGPSLVSMPQFSSARERVPSYTDRILLHSLPSFAPELRLHAYEMCDLLLASDHRPVSALLHLNTAPADIRRRAAAAFLAERAENPDPAPRPSASVADHVAIAIPPSSSPSREIPASEARGPSIPSPLKKGAAGRGPSSLAPSSKAEVGKPTTNKPTAAKANGATSKAAKANAGKAGGGKGTLIFYLRLSDFRVDLRGPSTSTQAIPPRQIAEGREAGKGKGGEDSSSPAFPPSPHPPISQSSPSSSPSPSSSSVASSVDVEASTEPPSPRLRSLSTLSPSSSLLSPSPSLRPRPPVRHALSSPLVSTPTNGPSLAHRFFHASLSGAPSVTDSGGNGPGVAGVWALFPLDSEVGRHRQERVVEYLDSAVCRSEASRWSTKTAHLLLGQDGLSYHAWADVGPGQGGRRGRGLCLTGAADVGLGGGLHVLLKLVDDKGVDLGQAVIPVPVSFGSGQSNSQGGGPGGARRVVASLTRHTEARGRVTCTVQVLKIKRER